MPSDAWSCPLDLADNEQIEIEDQLNGGIVEATVVDTINGVISVSVKAFMSSVFTIDPYYTKWRRTKPSVSYGVQCADKYCPIGWFEHAENVPGWRCRECRNHQ